MTWLLKEYNFEELIIENLMDRLIKSIERLGKISCFHVDKELLIDLEFLYEFHHHIRFENYVREQVINNRVKLIEKYNKKNLMLVKKSERENVITEEIIHGRQEFISWIKYYLKQAILIDNQSDKFKLSAIVKSNNGLQTMCKKVILDDLYLRHYVYLLNDCPDIIKEIVFGSYPSKYFFRTAEPKEILSAKISDARRDLV